MRKLPQIPRPESTFDVNQSLQSAQVVVTVARFLIRPIYSNDPVNPASEHQERHAAMGEMRVGCIE